MPNVLADAVLVNETRARARYPRFDRSTGSDRTFGSAVTIERKFSSLPDRFDEIRSLVARYRCATVDTYDSLKRFRTRSL